MCVVGSKSIYISCPSFVCRGIECIATEIERQSSGHGHQAKHDNTYLGGHLCQSHHLLLPRQSVQMRQNQT